MPRYAYDRLSAQDASFLFGEKPQQPMHVGAVAILEAGPLRQENGGIDIDRFRRAVESVLHWIPRYRQKLRWVPVEGWPVWVDDRQFDIGYHIRHVALPKPGELDQLKEMAARIHARPLDRQRALWEIWVIEGLEGGEQFALLNKIHHCMIDGAAGAALSQILMSASARVEEREPVPYMPRPAPSPAELLRDAIGRSVRQPLEWLRVAAAQDRKLEKEGPTFERRWQALKDTLGYALHPASDTPINGEIGPHRRLEWLTMPLDDVLELRSALGCKVNDIILATVCGAMRRYFFRRRVDTKRIDFRVAAPVSTRRAEHDQHQGNHVSSWIVPLPLDLDDPLEQLAALRERTEALKRSEAALALDTILQVAEWLPAPLISLAVGLAGGPANMIVTNVVGPRFPLYMLGARLLGMYPLVPLLPNSGLGVALFSYEGKLCWGFNGDHELLADLQTFSDDIRESFELLRRATVTQYMRQRTGEEIEVPIQLGKPSAPKRSTGSPAASIGGKRKKTRAAGSKPEDRSSIHPSSAEPAPAASTSAFTRESSKSSLVRYILE